MSSTPAVSQPSSVALDRGAPAPAGRLAVLTALAATATAVPIPFLPATLVGRVRGAVAHDALARHGLSLTTDARELLAKPESVERGAALLRRGAEFVARRLLGRLGPLALLGSVARGIEVYALGHLIDRYVETARKPGAVRVNADEARTLRGYVDKALIRALSPDLRPESEAAPTNVEDLRDDTTRWADTILLTGASLPGYVVRRLDAAFDAVVREEEARRG